MNISLTKEEFEKIVNGEIVTRTYPNFVGQPPRTVRIALQDIGFTEMYRAIIKAENNGKNCS